MSEHEPSSRARRHEKQREQKKKIIIFIGLGAVFCVILFSMIAFGNREKPNEEAEKSQAESAVENQKEHYETSDNNENSREEFEINEDEQDSKDDDETDIKEVESEDSNIIKAYEGDWEPVGTEQTGDHVTNYNDDSADRKEIRKAVSIATGIETNNMTEHWVGNGGNQKVEATVSTEGQEDYYRVHLVWVDGEGWKPTRVERLKEY